MENMLQMFDGLISLAAQWAQSQEAVILQKGIPLTEQEISDAKLVGVAHPEKIRLLKVDKIPVPDNPVLRQAAETTGFICPATAGLTVRYGIFIHTDYWGDRDIIAHELVHASQYERLGGFREFLEKYLLECIELGYPDNPLEQEAVELAKKIHS